jgi:hypothetical protein
MGLSLALATAEKEVIPTSKVVAISVEDKIAKFISFTIVKNIPAD